MSQLIRQAQRVEALAADSSQPKWYRLCQAVEALDRWDVARVPASGRKRLNAGRVKVGRILGRYALRTEQDYQKIEDPDLDRALEIIKAAASYVIAAELDRIVAELDAGIGRLPVKAIREVREHRDLMAPKLIQVIKDATSAAQAGNVPRGNAHFFAVFLLTELQVTEGFPAILEMFTLPGELPFELFGEGLTEVLNRVLSFFVGDQLDVLDRLITDRTLSRFVRWEAIKTYFLLVRDGRLTREAALSRLQSHLQWAINEADREIAGPLICELIHLSPKEIISDIREAFDRDLVDRFLLRWEDVEQSIVRAELGILEELKRYPETGIRDTIEELEKWYCFEKASPRRHRASVPEPHIEVHFDKDEAVVVPVQSHPVGRNDPCPCGSGKKYKKCCGSHR